jgi:uncharacterized protein
METSGGGIMERTVEFYSDGFKLAGTFRLPSNAAAGVKHPTVLLCQGFSLTQEVWLPAYSKAFNDAGFATLNLDYRTFGGSEGQPRRRLVPWAQVQDCRNALTFLETLPEAQGQALGVFGVSLGASVAVATAGTDSRVKAVTAVSGPADLHRVWSAFPGWPGFYAKILAARAEYVRSGKVTYIPVTKLVSSDAETCALIVKDSKDHPTWIPDVTFESLAQLVEFRPEDVAPHIRGGAQFIHVVGDVLVSPFESQSFYSKSGGDKEIIALEGCRHVDIYGSGRGFPLIVEHALRSFRKHLRH